jgi:hypothetical protein
MKSIEIRAMEIKDPVLNADTMRDAIINSFQIFHERTKMRELTSHRTNALNDCIVVEALDEPSNGGASHEYRIRGLKGPLKNDPIPTIVIRFQKGPIQEVGVNGISEESLLAILMDRLEGFQSDPYKCLSNELSLHYLRQAMWHLGARTRERQARGVEGTHGL